MKRKLSKAGGKALSVALAMATVVSAAPFSVAAEDNVALAQTQETEGNALRLWYDEEAPNSYTGGSSGLFRLETARLEPVCLAVFRQSEFS
jgi:alpha-L-fucosidase 2